MSGFDFMISMVCFAIVGIVIAYHVIKSAVRNGIKESGLINVKTTYEELRTSELSYAELRKGIVESNACSKGDIFASEPLEQTFEKLK